MTTTPRHLHLVDPNPPVTSARPHGSETVPESALVAGIASEAESLFGAPVRAETRALMAWIAGGAR